MLHNKMGCNVILHLSVLILIVDAKPWIVEKVCSTKTEENSIHTYEEYGIAVLSAVRGDPVDLALLGSDYLTKCLIKEYPKSKFLKKLDTGLQCAKTVFDTLFSVRHIKKAWKSLKSLFRDKRDIHLMPYSHKGKLNITAVAGEFLLRSLNLTVEIPLYRTENLNRDPRILPCDFKEYDIDGNGEITKSEFHETLHKKGFWPDELLFLILSKGDRGAIRHDTFFRITPVLHEYLKFEKCPQSSISPRL